MSIKSEITPPSEKSTIAFPKLMQTKLGTVALFISEQEAIVLKVISDSVYSVGTTLGEGAEAQYPAPRIDAWNDFEGTLTLSNEP